MAGIEIPAHCNFLVVSLDIMFIVQLGQLKSGRNFWLARIAKINVHDKYPAGCYIEGSVVGHMPREYA